MYVRSSSLARRSVRFHSHAALPPPSREWRPRVRPRRRRHGPPPLRLSAVGEARRRGANAARRRCRVSRPALTRARAPPPQLEVQGSEEGFFGSWYMARVTSADEASGTIALRYTELLQEDGTAETEVLHDASRLRPPLARWSGAPKQPAPVRCFVRSMLFSRAAAAASRRADAARGGQLSSYCVGDPVEVEYEEGWCARGGSAFSQHLRLMSTVASPFQVGGLRGGDARRPRRAALRLQPGGGDDGACASRRQRAREFPRRRLFQTPHARALTPPRAGECRSTTRSGCARASCTTAAASAKRRATTWASDGASRSVALRHARSWRALAN